MMMIRSTIKQFRSFDRKIQNSRPATGCLRALLASRLLSLLACLLACLPACLKPGTVLAPFFESVILILTSRIFFVGCIASIMHHAYDTLK